MKPESIILASQSKARARILRSLALDFIVIPAPDIEELDYHPEGPHDLAVHNALLKGRSVSAAKPGSLVIAADSVVFFDGRMIGKPDNETQARQMLSEFCGNTIQVITGVAVLWGEHSIEISSAATSTIQVKALTREEQDTFFPHLAPYDKAGGFSIEGHGAVIFDNIKGSYFTIIGLPLNLLYDLCRDNDIELF